MMCLETLRRVFREIRVSLFTTGHVVKNAWCLTKMICADIRSTELYIKLFHFADPTSRGELRGKETI